MFGFVIGFGGYWINEGMLVFFCQMKGTKIYYLKQSQQPSLCNISIESLVVYFILQYSILTMDDWCYMDIYSGYSHLVQNVDQEMSSLLTYGRPVSAVINLQYCYN